MKLKTNQSGFGHIALILGIVVILAIGFVGWGVYSNSSSEDSTKTNSSETKDQKAVEKEADIALENLGLASLDSIDVTTQATREFSSNKLKGFYVFGDKLSGGRTNPNFEYASVKPGSPVVSAIDGIVGFINQQPDTKDYEVFIQPKEGSVWTIGYDHLTDVAVKKGDTVKAGDVLGKPAAQNNGLLRFEMQINKDENGQTTHYCPTTLLAANVRDKWQAELTTMQNSWESKTGLELYDLTAQDPVGCLAKTLTPKQAEGN